MTILTDSEGLNAGMLQLRSGDHVLSAYHAMPDTGKQVPVVVVMHQTYGINEYSRDVCRRLAKAGYLAMLPDLYGRYGSVQGLSREEIAQGIARKVEDRGVMDDIRACVDQAASMSGDSDRLGVMGFAWGAQFVWLASAEISGCRAGVSWYGRLVRDASPQRPVHWCDTVARLKAPVLGLYAGSDPYVTPEVLHEMRQGLIASPVVTELVCYSEASHGFHADYQPQYRKTDAQDGWSRQMEWFRRHGVC
jgi:carboxymethylenebutenolidase